MAAAFAASKSFALRLDAALLLRVCLGIGLWACGAMIFLADTLAFYQIGIALYGGLLGVVTNYADGDHRNRVLRVSREWSATAIAKLQVCALLPSHSSHSSHTPTSDPTFPTRGCRRAPTG